MAKKRNSQHKRNTEEVTMPAKTEIESTTDKETPVEDNGITIINMKPRSSRNKHNDTQEITTVVQNNELDKNDDNIYDSRYATATKVDKQNESILSLSEQYDALQTDIDALNANHNNLANQYKNIVTAITATQNFIADTRTEFDNQVSSVCASLESSLARTLNEIDSKITTESNDRANDDRLLQSSIESISNQIQSITEGFDDYKARRRILDSEVSSHFTNIDEKLDKIDIDHLTTKVNNNQEISMSIQHHSILTMDFLIRTSRMMVISFVSLIFAMIAMLIVIMTPSLGLKIASGIFGIICAAFVVYEAKYIGNSIKKAKLSLDDLIKDSYV